MAGLLGLPAGGDDTVLIDCSHAITAAAMEPFPTVEEIRAAQHAGTVLAEHLGEALRWKRDHLGDDLISLLLRAAREQRTLSLDDVTLQVRSLFVAGHQTTVNGIGNAVHALLRHGSAWATLCAEPGRVPAAVEELLRYDNTIQVAWRTTPADYRLGDVTIPAGNHLILWTASANRDPDRWGADADDVDIARPDAAQHLSFGSGTHLCLGASLARAEIHEVLLALVTRFPGTELVGTPLRWQRLVSVRGLEALPVRLGR
jgi:cytochrome P450